MNRPPKRPRTPRKLVSTTGGPQRRPRRNPPRRQPRRSKGWLVVVLGLCAGLCSAALGLWFWGTTKPDTPSESFHALELPANLSSGQVLQRLEDAGLLQSSELARAYQLVLHPWFEYAPGVHWLRSGHSARELLTLVGRGRSRPVVRVVLPEGWDSFQMAERLAASGVCAPQAFISEAQGASADPNIQHTSLEGYLYPASYDFRLNSTPAEVTERLVKEAHTRFQRVFEASADKREKLKRELGLGPHELVTLASIVEKEAANAKELPLVASVFLNRLRDPAFRPARMLQSDPTAGYGCKVYKELASCSAYKGRVTPVMLRDNNNPFNTYKHPGLPPTPIGNPSTVALEAVLNAPPTNYLFFVSHDGGPHQFSATLEAHEAATRAQ